MLLGGVVAGAAIGPQCRVRGEVDASVILGFANKAHDGYLGRSIVGRWVNLGAMTSNSDLKNTYGVVRLRTGGRDVDTGLLKVGCFLGDHVRTGIGTLLNSGTVVGAGSSLFGGGMPARDVPPFSWCGAGGLDETRIDGFLETASRVMARRGVSMTDGVRRLYRRAVQRHRAPAKRRAAFLSRCAFRCWRAAAVATRPWSARTPPGSWSTPESAAASCASG